METKRIRKIVKRNPGKRNQKQREKALQCRCKNWGKGIY